MIPVIIQFHVGDEQKDVATSVPTLPLVDHYYRFCDSDRDVDLAGVVTGVDWEEVDGKLTITIVVDVTEDK